MIWCQPKERGGLASNYFSVLQCQVWFLPSHLQPGCSWCDHTWAARSSVHWKKKIWNICSCVLEIYRNSGWYSEKEPKWSSCLKSYSVPELNADFLPAPGVAVDFEPMTFLWGRGGKEFLFTTINTKSRDYFFRKYSIYIQTQQISFCVTFVSLKTNLIHNNLKERSSNRCCVFNHSAKRVLSFWKSWCCPCFLLTLHFCKVTLENWKKKRSKWLSSFGASLTSFCQLIWSSLVSCCRVQT